MAKTKQNKSVARQSRQNSLSLIWDELRAIRESQKLAVELSRAFLGRLEALEKVSREAAPESFKSVPKFADYSPGLRPKKGGRHE